VVSTQITDPSFLYSVTFGLVGSNKKDTPLAPTRRPNRDDTPYSFAMPQTETERSWLNVLTFGVLGNPGSQ